MFSFCPWCIEQSSLINQSFDFILALNVITNVMIVNFMETTILGFIRLRKFFEWVWVLYPRLLELCVCALLQDPLPKYVQGSL